MYILTIHGKEKEGAYSVIDDDGENILYLFEEEDDAIRFAMMLEESGSPEMHVIEVEDEIIVEVEFSINADEAEAHLIKLLLRLKLSWKMPDLLMYPLLQNM